MSTALLFCLHPASSILPPRFVPITVPFVNQERDYQEELQYTKLITHFSKASTLKGTQVN